MKKYLTALFLSMLLSTTQAQESFKDTNGKWGIKDSTGKIIIPGKYTSIGKFINNISVVGNETPMGELFGAIDANGKEITQIQYAEIHIDNFGSTHYKTLIKALDFNAVYWTLIDPITGKNITQSGRYYTIGPFIEGKALVEGANNAIGKEPLKGYIDETGKEIIPLGTSPENPQQKNILSDNNKLLISTYQKLLQDQKIQGAQFQSQWKSAINEIQKNGFTQEPIFKRQYEIYKNLINTSKDIVISIPNDTNNIDFKKSIIEFCNSEIAIAGTMFLIIKEEERSNIESNQALLEEYFNRRKFVSDQMQTHYKILIGELPKPAPKIQQVEKKPIINDNIFYGELNSNNQIINFSEDFTSADFAKRARVAIKNKGKHIEGKAIEFYINNPQYKNDTKSNFLFSDSYEVSYIYEQNMEAYKTDKLGYAFRYHGEKDFDARATLYTHSKNRKLTVTLSEGLKNKNVFYGIALGASSINKQFKSHEVREINDSDYCSYGILISNTSYNIVKYNGYNNDYNQAWANKDNQKIITKGKLQTLSPDNIHTLSIDKKDNTWNFYIDGSLVYTLTDTVYLHIIEEIGHIVVTGNSRIRLRKYEFIGTKN